MGAITDPYRAHSGARRVVAEPFVSQSDGRETFTALLELLSTVVRIGQQLGEERLRARASLDTGRGPCEGEPP